MARKRAANVCSACHDRKIRCDLDEFRTRCSNCQERGTTGCNARPRRAYRFVNRQRRRENAIRYNGSSSFEARMTNICSIDYSKIAGSIITQPSQRRASVYVGESGYGSIWDILKPEGTPCRQLTVNGAVDTGLSQADLEYLELKGCFDLPAQSDELIAAYFQFIHPIFPLLDGPSFLASHLRLGLGGMNLLLIWSIFSVSSSYVSEYAQKTTRALFHSRGKVLFDLSGENDKIVLIQSALLLSFWFDDAEDTKQSWYFAGNAFSIAQAHGLHRSRPSVNTQKSLEYSLWNCCLLRDTWLSYSMGRPLRLAGGVAHHEPVRIDWIFKDLIISDHFLYSEEESQALGRLWDALLSVTMVLRNALYPGYRLTESSLTTLDNTIEVADVPAQRLPLILTSYHLRLCKHAATVALCYTNSGIDTSKLSEMAADGILSLGNSYLNVSSAKSVPPTIVPLMMPAMLVSTSQMRHPEKSKMEEGKKRLLACVEFLVKIEDIYPAASIVAHLFSAIAGSLNDRQ